MTIKIVTKLNPEIGGHNHLAAHLGSTGPRNLMLAFDVLPQVQRQRAGNNFKPYIDAAADMVAGPFGCLFLYPKRQGV